MFKSLLQKNRLIGFWVLAGVLFAIFEKILAVPTGADFVGLLGVCIFFIGSLIGFIVAALAYLVLWLLAELALLAVSLLLFWCFCYKASFKVSHAMGSLKDWTDRIEKTYIWLLSVPAFVFVFVVGHALFPQAVVCASIGGAIVMATFLAVYFQWCEYVHERLSLALVAADNEPK